jgi:peptidyl-prolyl cis-trans isomerase C
MSLSRISAGLLTATLLCTPALAQTAPAGTPPAATPPAATTPAATPAAPPPSTPANAVVAKVNGKDIHLSDVQDAMTALPEQARGMPPQVLMPMVIDQLVDRAALADEARKQGLDKDPAVQAAIARATDQALQNALLRREIAPTITDAAIQARYDQQYKNKPGQAEVHARHILVATEQEAKDIIAQLQKGGDFAAIAKQKSTEPGAAQSGGDLGWFKKDDMVPEFSAAAFGLKAGQVDPQPVHTQFGWHVIQVLETRTAPPPSLDEAKDEIRQTMIQEGIQKAVEQARADAKIERFNASGAPQRPTDLAVPPPASK